MTSASLIAYDIARLEKSLNDYMPAATRFKLESILAKKKQQLPIARRRELKRLANYLTYKADIYGPNGRIYAADAKFTVSDDGKLFHGTIELDPDKLYDGHARPITIAE